MEKKELDWKNLKFEYEETYCHIRADWKNGNWGELRQVKDPYITLHVGSTALHYGQSVFEGLKAFRCKDGKVRIFRPDENAERLALSAERTMMPVVPKDMFIQAVISAVKENIHLVPPYGTSASLYIRPILLGTGPKVGLKPSDEYAFLVIVTPVGSYYKGGAKSVSALIMDDYDRAAKKGMGPFKVAGNYAAALLPNQLAVRDGHPITLFLDPVEHKFIEEFNSSNFVAISKSGAYLTPNSESILKSITNKSLLALARDENIPVEHRAIEFEKEVETFVEVGAVGTAVIITPINRIVRGNRVYEVGEETMGPILTRLFKRLSGIQIGESEDKFGWMVEVPE